jgi:HAMP domain-containing protein
VSEAVNVAGLTYLVEARPTPSGAFALVRTTESGPLRRAGIQRNIGLALLAGGVVAVLVGVVVGTLLARPLRRTADAAHLLRGGRRDVRVPVEGPREVAEVATAVNELADALARSEQRQREFLLSVSHELRTPLTAVRGFAESLADGVVQGPEVAPTGRIIDREAQRLDRLVSDLMELARLEADDFRVDLMPATAGTARSARVVWAWPWRMGWWPAWVERSARTRPPMAAPASRWPCPRPRPAAGRGGHPHEGSGIGRPNNPSSASRSSLAALRLRRLCPQTTHRCTTTISPRSDSAAMGSIAPPHSASRSPGFTSTCCDHRHRGQWLV